MGLQRVSTRSTVVPTMPTRQTIIMVTVISLLLLYFFTCRTTSSQDTSAPNVPSREADGTAYRQRLVAVGDLHGGAFGPTRCVRSTS